MTRRDLTGHRFGKLVALSAAAPGTYPKSVGTAWLCRCDCGQEKVVGTQNLVRSTRSCGCGAWKVGPEHHLWKGGTFNKDGYVVVRGKRGETKQRFQHRVVMEEHIGRPLLLVETVHHINGDRANNCIENLELWSGSQPRGQRVADKVAWAKEILALYQDL